MPRSYALGAHSEGVIDELVQGRPPQQRFRGGARRLTPAEGPRGTAPAQGRGGPALHRGEPPQRRAALRKGRLRPAGGQVRSPGRAGGKLTARPRRPRPATTRGRSVSTSAKTIRRAPKPSCGARASTAVAPRPQRRLRWPREEFGSGVRAGPSTARASPSARTATAAGWRPSSARRTARAAPTGCWMPDERGGAGLSAVGIRRGRHGHRGRPISCA